MRAGQQIAICGEDARAAGTLTTTGGDFQARDTRHDSLHHRGHCRRVGVQQLAITIIDHVGLTPRSLICSLAWPRSAAAAGGTAAFADVAATTGAHLGTAGEAEGRVDAGAGDLLEQLRCGPSTRGCRLGDRYWFIQLIGVDALGTNLICGDEISRVVLQRLRLADLLRLGP